MILAYHWTKMQIAISLMKKKKSDKFLYWSTNKDEATWYAKISKYEDNKYWKWTIIEAQIDDKKTKLLNINDRKNIYWNENDILKWENWLLDLWDFKVIITQPKQKIEEIKITEII